MRSRNRYKYYANKENIEKLRPFFEAIDEAEQEFYEKMLNIESQMQKETGIPAEFYYKEFPIVDGIGSKCNQLQYVNRFRFRK